ncbi:MAG: uracil-DNA glycosylase [Flavicella sp.]
MLAQLPKDWQDKLSFEFEQAYFHSLTDFVNKAYVRETCYPPFDHIFSAFKACSFEGVKVVILGQDPYHDMGQANGLCFSVAQGIKHPPSLVNILKELQTDCGKTIPDSGDLTHWAQQGVLLLNATLTVAAHQAGSHQRKGWEQFTDAVIKLLSDQKEGLVFMLWGGYARKKGKKIDTQKHYVLEAGHPSPLSANRGYWFGNRHFSKCNAILEDLGKDKIAW